MLNTTFPQRCQCATETATLRPTQPPRLCPRMRNLGGFFLGAAP